MDTFPQTSIFMFWWYDSTRETLKTNMNTFGALTFYLVGMRWDLCWHVTYKNCLNWIMISIMRRFAKGNVEYCNNSIPIPSFLWSFMKEILWCIFGGEWQKLQLQICCCREEKEVELKHSIVCKCPAAFSLREKPCFRIIQSILKSIQFKMCQNYQTASMSQLM